MGCAESVKAVVYSKLYKEGVCAVGYPNAVVYYRLHVPNQTPLDVVVLVSEGRLIAYYGGKFPRLNGQLFHRRVFQVCYGNWAEWVCVLGSF